MISLLFCWISRKKRIFHKTHTLHLLIILLYLGYNRRAIGEAVSGSSRTLYVSLPHVRITSEPSRSTCCSPDLIHARINCPQRSKEIRIWTRARTVHGHRHHHRLLRGGNLARSLASRSHGSSVRSLRIHKSMVLALVQPGLYLLISALVHIIKNSQVNSEYLSINWICQTSPSREYCSLSNWFF
jgi:hypothetical protein